MGSRKEIFEKAVQVVERAKQPPPTAGPPLKDSRPSADAYEVTALKIIVMVLVGQVAKMNQATGGGPELDYLNSLATACEQVVRTSETSDRAKDKTSKAVHRILSRIHFNPIGRQKN